MEQKQEVPCKLTYRSAPYDDWGQIRDETGFTVCNAKVDVHLISLDLHRKNKTDPYQAFGEELCRRYNTHATLTATIEEQARTIEDLKKHLLVMIKYNKWQYKEGSEYHPTLPSAIAAAEEALALVQPEKADA